MCINKQEITERINEWVNDGLSEKIQKKSKFLNPAIVTECKEGFYESSVRIFKRLSYELTNIDCGNHGKENTLNSLYDDIIRDTSTEYDTIIIKILKTLYAPEGILYKTHTVDCDDIMTMETILNSKYKLGDESNKLKISVFHTDIVRQLTNEIDTNTYKNKTGMEIIACDLLLSKFENEKNFSFLLGENSIGFKNVSFETYVETNQLKGGGTHYININVESYLYFYGVVHNFNICYSKPDEYLRNLNNWVRLANHDKDIKIIALLNPVVKPC